MFLAGYPSQEMRMNQGTLPEFLGKRLGFIKGFQPIPEKEKNTENFTSTFHFSKAIILQKRRFSCPIFLLYA